MRFPRRDPERDPHTEEVSGGGKVIGGPLGARLSQLVPEAIDDICAKDGDHLRAYCFCCPALRIDEFHGSLLRPTRVGHHTRPLVQR
jgi:hypothetical protein